MLTDQRDIVTQNCAPTVLCPRVAHIASQNIISGENYRQALVINQHGRQNIGARINNGKTGSEADRSRRGVAERKVDMVEMVEMHGTEITWSNDFKPTLKTFETCLTNNPRDDSLKPVRKQYLSVACTGITFVYYY